MTLLQARQRVLRLTRKLGTYHGDGIEETDVFALLDEAMARIAQCFFYDPAITFTVVANQSEYRFDTAFGKRIVNPHVVRLNGVALLDHAGLPGLWSVVDFEKAFPNFVSTSAGQPSIAVQYGSILRLHVPPSTTFASSCTGYVSGEFVPGWTDGTSYWALASSAPSSAVPDLPLEFHELVPELAVHLGTVAVGDSETAWQIILKREAGVAARLERLRNRNRAAYSSTPYRSTNTTVYF